MKLALPRLFLLCAVASGAQAVHDDEVLAKIQKRLASSEKLKYHSPMVFVGEIIGLGPVYQGVYKVAVGQEVEFTISRRV